MLRSSHVSPDCLTLVNETPFYIKDQESGSCELSTADNWDLKVENKTKNPVHFFKIDKCVFNDGHGKRCDCAVFNENESYFVEIKELENFDSTRKRKERRSAAKKQLIASINDFKGFGLRNLSKVTAVIALSPALETKIPTLITTRDQATIDEFLTQCGCPNLVQGNYIEFK